MSGSSPSPSVPTPKDIYDRAEVEGSRRLSMSLPSQVMTGFIAGVTIMLGLAGLGITEALTQPTLGPDLAQLAGALAFGIGLVFLVVGRTELFSENFFDPVAAAFQHDSDRPWVQLGRLWITILVLNLVGGAVLVGILTIDGALPAGASDALVHGAEEIAHKSWTATLARAVLAGALVALLSYMLNAVDTVVARILLAYSVGFLVAVGPFDHVVVSGLHLLFGIWNAAAIGYTDLLANIGIATVGNLTGGLLLITVTHTAQVKAE